MALRLQVRRLFGLRRKWSNACVAVSINRSVRALWLMGVTIVVLTMRMTLKSVVVSGLQ